VLELSNHDVMRAATRWHPSGAAAGHDPDFVRLLMSLLLSLRGSALVYQGEELGLPEAELAEHELRDPFGIAHWPEFRGRDGSRTPLPWSAALPHAGFTTGTPWLPVPAAHHALAAEGSALAEDWRQMIALRRASPALRLGSLAPLDLPTPLAGFVREWRDERVLCVFNLDEAPAALPRNLPAEARWIGGLPDALPRFGTLLAGYAAARQAA
jgi:alpha-glucosidase